MTLTRTGWPRPIVNGLPIPWISPADSLATTNHYRHAACASGAVCAVCGEGYREEEEAFVVVNEANLPDDLTGGEVWAMDNGIMHRRCLHLALKMCPALVRAQAVGLLKIIRTIGNAAETRLKDDKPHAVIDGALCEVVEFSEL